jgi:TetR/AcrR family transcriptional regulator, transcriptional repressor for nem operon
MRYDAEHKQRTRERLLKEAASAIRLEGPDRIAVAGVMAKAGLTHGGFYAHFASKEELVVRAIEQMFVDGRNRFDRTVEGKAPAEALAAYIDFYLSESHRDHRDRGCPLPALSGDLARLDLAARETFEQGVGRLTSALAEKLAALGRDDAEGLATSMLSELVGALVVARSIADPARSDAILAASRRGLKARLGLPAETSA